MGYFLGTWRMLALSMGAIVLFQYEARREGASVYSILNSASRGDTRALERYILMYLSFHLSSNCFIVTKCIYNNSVTLKLTLVKV